MIGVGLKKLAKQNGMREDAGVAYGLLKGYATVLSEGMGYKQITISTTFPEGQKEKLMELTQGVDMQKVYRVQQLVFHPEGILVQFHDTVGTMKKLEAFIEWFYSLLPQVGATGGDICRECGSSVMAGQWYLMGDFAHYLHDTCGQTLLQEMEQAQQEAREQDEGSYVQGAIGAALGALLGAVVWGIVLYLGYVASILGLLIGWLANKGYDLLRGRKGKGKVVILILAVLLGVLVGTLAPDAYYLGQLIHYGELPGYTYGSIPYMLIDLLIQDGEYLGSVISNSAMGILFAALGVVGLLKRTSREVSGTKVKKLK
ncbi:MAG: hypothetical protein IKU57_04230 [Oscillospiraceae bacterium]|nr:hypothetical protein [Oscillospiraceae bacterium]